MPSASEKGTKPSTRRAAPTDWFTAWAIHVLRAVIRTPRWWLIGAAQANPGGVRTLRDRKEVVRLWRAAGLRHHGAPMATALRAHVIPENGEAFDAMVANLAPSSLYLVTDAPLTFKQALTLQLGEISLHGEVAFACTEPAGVVVVFRASAEALERVQADYEELFGDDGHVGELRRELAETFLPRYLRLAAQQTALEERARGLWAGGLLARAGAFAAAMLAALVVSRLIRNPFVIAFYISAFLVPFLPELRRWWEGRAYLAELQAMIDDLARVQDQLAEHRPRLLPPPHDGA